jgi:SAM-dependent methyltransferase
MGVLKTSAEYLIQEAARGVPFGEVLTLGRQNLLVSPKDLIEMLQKYGWDRADLSEDAFLEKISQSPGNAAKHSPYYADGLLEVLGAQTVSAMDASSFEDARIIHDLNQPIPENLQEQFDLVLDGGLLEHVFNFPIAIKSCMQMVRVGGRFILITPANNLFGHGFYQFSPELFYRIFSPENGFEIERMVVMEMDLYRVKILGGIYAWMEEAGAWYDVVDPHQTGGRVTLRNRNPVYLHITARRTRTTEIFAQIPQQSDYATIWNAFEENQANRQSDPVPAQPAEELLPAPQRKGSWAAQLKNYYHERVDYYQALHLRFHVLPRLVRLFFPKYLAEAGKIKRSSSFQNKTFYKPVRSEQFKSKK